MVSTAVFTFPVLTMALQPGARSLQALAHGLGTAREAGGSGSMAAGGAGIAWPPAPGLLPNICSSRGLAPAWLW